jgi:hypothetical protein
MNDAQIASWLSADGAAWVSIVVPALIAIGVAAFVVLACIRHKPSREAPSEAPREPQRSVRSAGVVFFPR